MPSVKQINVLLIYQTEWHAIPWVIFMSDGGCCEGNGFRWDSPNCWVWGAGATDDGNGGGCCGCCWAGVPVAGAVGPSPCFIKMQIIIFRPTDHNSFYIQCTVIYWTETHSMKPCSLVINKIRIWTTCFWIQGMWYEYTRLKSF